MLRMESRRNLDLLQNVKIIDTGYYIYSVDVKKITSEIRTMAFQPRVKMMFCRRRQILWLDCADPSLLCSKETKKMYTLQSVHTE